MRFHQLALALAIFLVVGSVGHVSAQVASPELDACRSTGLIALRERDPSIKEMSFDLDGVTVAKANTKIEETVIKTILLAMPISKKTRRILVEHFCA